MLENVFLGSGPNHSYPPTGAHRTRIRLESRFMCIETATQGADQSQVSPGLRMARHPGGDVVQVFLDMKKKY